MLSIFLSEAKNMKNACKINIFYVDDSFEKLLRANYLEE